MFANYQQSVKVKARQRKMKECRTKREGRHRPKKYIGTETRRKDAKFVAEKKEKNILKQNMRWNKFWWYFVQNEWVAKNFRGRRTGRRGGRKDRKIIQWNNNKTISRAGTQNRYKVA